MAKVERPWRGGELKYNRETWVKSKDEETLIRSLQVKNKKRNNDKRLEGNRRAAALKRSALYPEKLKLVKKWKVVRMDHA